MDRRLATLNSTTVETLISNFGNKVDKLMKFVVAGVILITTTSFGGVGIY